MKLYMTGNSGNACKTRLLLSMLNVPFGKAIIDARGGEHKKEPYLKVNPRGQVPALEDGGKMFWGSTACLAYIARKHGGGKWLPTDPAGMAEVAQWLALGRPTVADVACYPYVSVSPEGGFKLEDYPSVTAWTERFEALPGWVKRV